MVDPILFYIDSLRWEEYNGVTINSMNRRSRGVFRFIMGRRLIYCYNSEMHNDRRPSIFISIDGYGRSGKHYGMLDDCKTKTGSAGLF